MKTRAQITIATLALIGTVISSGIVAWGSSSSAASRQVNEIDSKVNVIEERENNHYSELSKKVDKIDDKLNVLIQRK